MKLNKYLTKKRITRKGFAERCNMPYNTLLSILEGKDFYYSWASIIRRETQEEVDYIDLEPKKPLRRLEKLRKKQASETFPTPAKTTEESV